MKINKALYKNTNGLPVINKMPSTIECLENDSIINTSIIDQSA